MKRLLLFSIVLLSVADSSAQSKIKDRKYPSLLWEITGNGTKKPSYLIGTMHVSSKLAFNLPDSFYIALKNSNVVALETNPETWQEDMSKYDLGDDYSYANDYGDYTTIPADYLSINTLKFYKYDTKIERSLYSNPSSINNLLYRSYGNESSDFEEDTYLDMYIFQVGKKWGKKVAGVENYGESMQLMAEAYKDAAKDKSRKERSYDDMDDEYSLEKLQEAYRTGNLDLLDSINRYNSFSEAFDEKFLYKRNEIQARNIDSIIRSGSVLFVGVGAAHLPGQRGVIEMLRRMGYKVRPVKMGERASRDKDIVDKIRVPVVFRTETADDGLYKVDIPGKFYKFGEDGALDQRQYADMANGSYYMVTRIMTNAWMWSHSTDDVYRTIDSLLYENIPGKMIAKTAITRNGHKGFDITNRTRRGDVQRYNIFITPFEIIFFKMSGNSDYVSNGEEAKKFFGSIQLKEYKNGESNTAWKKYAPPYGGFSVDMPHEPYVGNDGSWIYDAGDKTAGTHYRVIRTDIHNYHFVEEDTFDLGLMDESFMASDFIETQLSRQHTIYKGYPALESKYRDKKGYIYLVRFVIQGPHYYTIVAHGKQETPAMKNFMNSFSFTPFVYGVARQQKDTTLYYTVQTPVNPEDKKIKIDIPRYSYGSPDEEEDESEDLQLESGAFRNKVLKNDSTGERIYISFHRSGRYYYSKDSSVLEKDNEANVFGTDSGRIVRWNHKSDLPNKFKVWETKISDTGSSRMLWGKTFYKDGIGFTIATQTDTLSQPSEFVKKFFETFTPADTLKSMNPFAKKSDLFFDDLMSADSVVNKRAVKNIDDIYLDSTDLPRLKKVITWLNWDRKKYLNIKTSLINKLGDIRTASSSLYLKDLYYALDDTVQFQYSVLENLLQHKTAYAFSLFRDIIYSEPPVLDMGNKSYSSYRRTMNRYLSEGYDDGDFVDNMFDSLKLVKPILQDILPLVNLQEYRGTIMRLLGQMVDSNIITRKDYDAYFSKFMLEAKQELKKQSILEKKKAIEKAAEDKDETKSTSSYYDSDDEKDAGNDILSLYATLLLPFWDTNPQVQPLIAQMLRSNDKRLRYSTMLLMIRSNKPYPDSLLTYFAGLDDYRYELYSDLRTISKPGKFPSAFNNHIDLGRSALLEKKSYGKPDSIVYIDRLPAEYKGKKGFIYFFRVKTKKDDLTWKLATVGLVPEDPKQFEFEDKAGETVTVAVPYVASYKFNKYDFTGFTDTKLKDDESLNVQLKKALKKMLYSRRKSAKDFYDDTDRNNSTGYDD